MHSINFTVTKKKKKNCPSLHYYNGANSYDATDIDDIKDIHKYLMKKNNIV